ncbi:hypothetical protein [Phyllobacterium myrsinacearum]|uniref:hypothetical protein n=1 Tax=Phyllobacterium myrsinacearum TaxID=28101 RepID=UPI001FE157B3|nr:hypothetical protein [Phyllobacterium myrsinacearum]
MKHRTNAIQGDTNARALPFRNLASAGKKESLDIPPMNTGPDGFGKNGGKRRLMLPVETHIMISLFSINKIYNKKIEKIIA